MKVWAWYRRASHFQSAPVDDTSGLLHAFLDKVEDVDPGVAAGGFEEFHREAQDIGPALPRDHTNLEIR